MTKTAKPVEPKNKLLNQRDRDLLYKFAAEHISAPAEKQAVDTSYEKCKQFVLATVNKAFPPADMKVLEKYGAARVDCCIRFGGPYDHESVFQFRDDDKSAPLLPRYNDCSSRQYDWTTDERKALNAHVLAVRKLHAALAAKREDYRKLIVGCRTFNEVTTIWPAAEKLRNTIIPATVEQRALAVLSEEAIARIKADNAGGK